MTDWMPPATDMPVQSWAPPATDEPVERSQYLAKTTPEAMPWYQRFGSGLRDPLEGAAQLVSHVVPAPVERAVNAANNWLADKTGLVAKLPEGGMDAYEKQRDASIQAGEKAAGVTGTDWARLGGNVASPMNYIPLAKLGTATTALGRVGEAALGGSFANALNPVTEGDNFWWEKGKQAATGAAAGGATGAAGEAVAKAVSPEFRAAAKKLLDEGVSLTPGQLAGGIAKRAEDTAKSIPILGSAIRNGERKSIETFNRAAINRSLEPIGESLPKGLDAGREAIDYAATKLGDAYDKLLPNITAELDPGLQKEIGTVSHLGNNLPAPQKAQLDSIIKNEIVDRFNPQTGKATGFTAKEIESQLGQMASEMGRSADYDIRRLGGAVKELQASIRRMVERVNPQQRGALQQINKGWANLKRVQRASASVGAKDGVFTPAQLLNAVKALDPSKDKMAFSKGKALMQDLADAAKDVLPQTVPDSGTAGRLIGWDALFGGGSWFLNPHIPMGLMGASLPYTSPGMNLLRSYATVAPATRNYLARAVQQVGPAVAPGAAILAQPAP